MDPKEREKLILMGGIGVVAVLIVAFLAFYTAGKASDLEKRITTEKRTLKEVQGLAVEYAQIKQRSMELEGRMQPGGPPLLSYLEGMCRAAQITNPSLNPRRTGENEYYEETSVELKATGLTLEQMMNLLNSIETSQRYLRIKSFKVDTPYAKKELLDITLQVSSYAPKATGAEVNPTEPEPGMMEPGILEPEIP